MNMTVLELGGFFRLPEEFSGGLADAFRLLADYYEQSPDKRVVIPGGTIGPYDRTKQWNGFVDLVNNSEKRLLMRMGIWRFDDFEWEEANHGPATK